MNIRIGTNPIAWSNDDMPELGADISLDTCLTQAKAAGYEGMELGHKFPRDGKQLAPVLERHGLDLIGGWYSTNLLERGERAEMKAAADHVRLLKDMGCTVFIMAETTGAVHGDRRVPLSQKPVLDDGQWPMFCARMNGFSAWLRDQDLLPAYHHHMGTVVETEEEIRRFMDGADDSAGLLIDSGHAAFAGANMLDLARDFAGRITHVHCKDIRPDVLQAATAQECSFLDAVVDGVFTVPGDGGLDFSALLNVLRQGGYSGWLVVEAEQDPARADPERYAKMGHDNLARMAAAAGFTRSVS